LLFFIIFFIILTADFKDFRTDFLLIDFLPDFLGDFLLIDFLGDFLPDFLGDFLPDFLGDFLPDFLGDFRPDFLGDFRPDFLGDFRPDFLGDFLPDFLPDFLGDLLLVDFLGDLLLVDFLGDLLEDLIAGFLEKIILLCVKIKKNELILSRGEKLSMSNFRRLNKTQWTLCQDEILQQQFHSGMKINEIAKQQQRTYKAILSRLRHLRKLKVSQEPHSCETFNLSLPDLHSDLSLPDLHSDLSLPDLHSDLPIPDLPNLSIPDLPIADLHSDLPLPDSPIPDLPLPDLPLPDSYLEFNEEKYEIYKNRYITIIDTETTGLLPDKKITTNDNEGYRFCRILQFAYECYTEEGEFVKKECFYIKPTYDFDYSEAEQIHHISYAMTHEKGIPHREFIQRLKSLVDETLLFVAHNMDFDNNVIESEWHRDDWGRLHVSEWKQVPKECTLLMARHIFPFDPNSNHKLATVHSKCNLVVEKGTMLHQADSDTRMCAQIYFHIRGRAGKRFYLHVNWADTQVVKLLGGVFDWSKKKWFVYDNCHWKKYLLRWFS